MNLKPRWFLIETEQEYDLAIARYEQIKNATAGAEHKEKLLLAHLIENYENSLWDLPEINPVEMIKIRWMIWVFNRLVQARFKIINLNYCCTKESAFKYFIYVLRLMNNELSAFVPTS